MLEVIGKVNLMHKFHVLSILFLLISGCSFNKSESAKIDICEPFKLVTYTYVDTYQVRTVGPCLRLVEHFGLVGYVNPVSASSTTFEIYGSREEAEKRATNGVLVFTRSDEVTFPDPTKIYFVKFKAKYGGLPPVNYIGDMEIFEENE